MSDDVFARRSFVTGAAVLGAGLTAAAPAQAAAAPWRPALEKQDDWMELPGAHRLVFDCTSGDGLAGALNFAVNYFEYNRKGYGLAPPSLAVIMIFRHHATPFGYDDAVWAKYGAILSETDKLIDPSTKLAPARNPYGANRGVTLPDMAKLGVRFAVCGAATERLAEMVAHKIGAKPDAVNAELAAGLIPNGRLVPAGIVALNRTQERGYAVAHAG